MLVGDGRTYQTGRPGSGLIPSLKGATLNMTPFADKAGADGANAIVTATNTMMAGPRGVTNSAVFARLGAAVQNVVIGKDAAAELAAVQAVADRQM